MRRCDWIQVPIDSEKRNPQSPDYNLQRQLEFELVLHSYERNIQLQVYSMNLRPRIHILSATGFPEVEVSRDTG